MQDTNTRETISKALEIANEMNPQATDGTWLEDLTVQVGPYIKEWDIDPVLPLVRMAGARRPLPQ